MGPLRNSNVELLCIVAMFAVIFLHINDYVASNVNECSYSKLLFTFLGSCCISAADIFIDDVIHDSLCG